MANCYQYTADGYFVDEVEDYGLLPNNATYTAPPARLTEPWERVWPRWAGDAWELIEDHRERKPPYFAEEFTQEATEFWMPAPHGEDTHESQPRTMKEPGPLPEGYSLTRPEKTQEDFATDLRSQRDTRIAATDYLMAADYPLDDAQRAAWAAYRQALRDMPQVEGFPWDGGGELTPWPVKPV